MRYVSLLFFTKKRRAENSSNPPLVVALKMLMLVAAELQIRRDGYIYAIAKLRLLPEWCCSEMYV